MFNYPFHFWYYKSSIKILGIKIYFPRIVYFQDLKLNPVYWATSYYDSDNEYYCYDSYEDYENYEDYDDNYYCYDSYEEDEEGEEEDLLADRYCERLLICSSVRRINGYTALASKHVLIADIDNQNTEEALDILREYVKENDAYFKVYKTLNGMRYIQLDTIYQNVNRSAINTLEYLKSDSKYIAFCHNDGRFMARITPKSSSEKMNEYLSLMLEGQQVKERTCQPIYYVGNKSKINPAVEVFVEAHDRLTNAANNYLPLA